MQDIHVATCHSAAGTLRYAIDAFGLSGEVFLLDDELSLGPLDGCPARLAFLRDIFLPVPMPRAPAEPVAIADEACVFLRWRVLQARCQQPVRVMLWISGNGADHVLLRMACHYLQGTRAVLWQIRVPPFKGGHEAVAAHPPEALARFATDAAPLSHEAVAQLAADYLTIAARPEPLRQCDTDGTLRYRPIDWHDPLVLACCPPAWTPANRVVGLAMSRCDPRQVMGDYFFAARLRALIQAGRVQTRTPLPGDWWDWRIEVRRPED